MLRKCFVINIDLNDPTLLGLFSCAFVQQHLGSPNIVSGKYISLSIQSYKAIWVVWFNISDYFNATRPDES